MQTQKKLNQTKVIVIIEAFTDYLEHYCEQHGETYNLYELVIDHFDEFTSWAYDDFILSKEERDSLLSIFSWELRESIINEVLSHFRAA
jgi:hypothetical protein